MLLWLVLPVEAGAQVERPGFAGVLVGVSALSADARAVTDAPDARVSLYAPENGLAFDAFAGVHLTEYFSLQLNYVWNENDLTLVSASVTARGRAVYEQHRTSAQHAVVLDGLVYFRRRDSRFRPYLGTGLAVVRFTSSEGSAVSRGLAPPGPDIGSTRLALRSHVGIDVRLSRAVTFRYSFSETLSGNPISPHLTPLGARGFANYQHLLGFLTRF